MPRVTAAPRPADEVFPRVSRRRSPGSGRKSYRACSADTRFPGRTHEFARLFAGTDRALLRLVDATTSRARAVSEPATPAPSNHDAPGFTAAIFAPFRDAWIAARARLAILVALRGEAGDVTVEAYRGNVVLSGDVATRAARDAAEQAVHALGYGVANRLRARGEHVLRPGATDAEIRAAVSARLREARALRSSIVTIENVYDGVVRLTGVAHDAHAAAEAFELAVHVPGVRRVINDVAPHRPRAADDDADAA